MIHEGPWLWACHVAGADIELESRSPDQVVHLAIEVTASADPFPIRRHPIAAKGYSAFL
jgi:hypothetical protein